MAKFNDFEWEDEDVTKAEEAPKKELENSDFASMLAEQSFEKVYLRVGAQVKGTITSINPKSDDVLIDISSQQTGVMDKRDLMGEDGELAHNVGESIDLFVISLKDSTIQLSKNMGKSHQSALELEMAQHNEVPIRGKVHKATKGGFEVQVAAKLAFCPISKIDRGFVENAEDYVGKEFDFLIEKLENNGRNIVVSREKLLQKQAAERLKDIEKLAERGEILPGIVKEIRDYGAFVDLGGIDGFLHISELSFARVANVKDFLEVRENIKVKILDIKTENGKQRISLSMKATEQDPWTALEDYEELETYTGKVVRLSKHGAFVELKPGLDGLIHISEMSWEKRIHDPSEVLSVGDKVQVKILKIDKEAKRISLSLKGTMEDPFVIFTQGLNKNKPHKAEITNLKGFGAIVELAPGVSGLIPLSTLKAAHGESYRKKCSPPKIIDVMIKDINYDDKKILLTLPEIKDDDDSSDYQDYLANQITSPTEKSTGTFGALLKAKLEGKNK